MTWVVRGARRLGGEPTDLLLRDGRVQDIGSGLDAAGAQVLDADGLVALGGGSAIDTAKAVSAETGLPVVSIPTTYSGAEWTSGFGVRHEKLGRKVSGGGARGARATWNVPRCGASSTCRRGA